MSAASRLKYLHLAYASNPKVERFLYRAIRKNRATRIVEFGLTSLLRTQRMIAVAQRYAPSATVNFTGIDLFEAACTSMRHAEAIAAEPRSLIATYKQLKPTGATLRLIPGTLCRVLPDSANSLPGTDLLLIGNTIADNDLEGVWYFLPRMLHPGSLVLREQPATRRDSHLEEIPLTQVQRLAASRPREAA